MQNDRSVAGAISGSVAALIQEIYGSLVKYVGISDKDFGDFAGVMIMSKNYQGIFAHIVQWIAHIGIGMLFGIIFAQIFKYTSSKYWWLKGLIYGLILWVLLTSIGTLYKMPVWIVTEPKTVLSILAGSLIYSFITAYILKILDKRSDLI